MSVYKLLYAIILIFLTIYSYTQVDLNLTLSSNSFYQEFQKQLTYIGFFNRPLSTLFASLIFLFMFTNYWWVLRLGRKGLLKLKDFKHLIIMTILILFFSYPAFSYDIFNYIFDARIAAHYHLNPYEYKALDFPQDDWTRFMRWTHRTYPYGPSWLALTIPVYLLGLGKFILTLIMFKLFFIASFLLSIYFLYKILQALRHTGGSRNTKDSPGVEESDRLSRLAFFAFNPLVIVETLVSPHNESIMLLGILLSFYLILLKKNSWSYVSLLLSGGVKFLSWILFPLLYLYQTKKLSFDTLLRWSFWIILIALVPIVYYREPYPWYFVTLIGIAALIKSSKFITYLTISLSIATLLRYLPFIYFGDYTETLKSWRLYLTIIPIMIALITYFFIPILLRFAARQSEKAD